MSEDMRCHRCNQLQVSMWGNFCNQCRDADEKHREIVNANQLRAEVARLTAERDDLNAKLILAARDIQSVKDEAHQRGKEEGAREALIIAGRRTFENVAFLLKNNSPETENEKQARLNWIEDAMTEWKARQQKREGE
jgi:hypothetical protein